AVDKALSGSLNDNAMKRILILAVLAPHLERIRLEQELEAIFASLDDSIYKSTIGMFLPFLPLRTPSLLREIQHFIVNTLSEFKNERREKILDLCKQEGLLAPNILGMGILNLCVTHILEICHEWQWL